MAGDKKFYWIKLKDTFMTSDTVDFLMGQKNGASYVVLYQMLCLKTVNTNGELARKIGEIIIPYDADKIQRDCKYFDIDTIRVALELYKQLGLIYKQEDNILKIANFENMVGTSSNERVERFRENKKLIAERKIPNIEKHTNNKRYGGYYYTALQRDKHTCRICGSEDTIVMHHIVPYDANNDETVRLENLVSLCASCHGKLHKSRSRADLPPTAVLDDIGFDDILMAIYNSLNEYGSLCNVTSSVTVTGIEKEIRDKRLDKDIDIKESTTSSTKEKAKRFIPPTLEEVENYCLERKNNVDYKRFVNFYTAKNWYIGKNKMKDWKAAVRTWEKEDKGKDNYIKQEYSSEQLKNVLFDFENWEEK